MDMPTYRINNTKYRPLHNRTHVARATYQCCRSPADGRSTDQLRMRTRRRLSSRLAGASAHRALLREAYRHRFEQELTELATRFPLRAIRLKPLIGSDTRKKTFAESVASYRTRRLVRVAAFTENVEYNYSLSVSQVDTCRYCE